MFEGRGRGSRGGEVAYDCFEIFSLSMMVGLLAAAAAAAAPSPPPLLLLSSSSSMRAMPVQTNLAGISPRRLREPPQGSPQRAKSCSPQRTQQLISTATSPPSLSHWTLSSNIPLRCLVCNANSAAAFARPIIPGARLPCRPVPVPNNSGTVVVMRPIIGVSFRVVPPKSSPSQFYVPVPNTG